MKLENMTDFKQRKIADIQSRITDEHRKHKEFDWAKIAANRIYATHFGDAERLDGIRQFAELSVPDRFDPEHKVMVGELATMLILNPEDVDVVLPKYTEAVGWWNISPLV